MWNCNSMFGFSGGGGFHALGGTIHLLFWAALILVIIWAIKRFTSQPVLAAQPTGAISTLDNRLARGEISPEEYRTTKQTLNKG